MRRLLRKVWVVYKIWWQQELEYRVSSVFWVVNGLVPTLFVMLLWLVASRSTNNFPMTESAIITYFLLVGPVDRLTQVWSWERLEETIRTGYFTNYLLRPLHYLSQDLGETLARKTIRVVQILPIFLILLLVFRDKVSFEWKVDSLVVFPAAILSGFFLRFLYQNFMGLSAFWLTRITGLEEVVGSFSVLLSGAFIPLSILPTGLASLAQFLPFRYFVSFPIEIILGQVAGAEILKGFVVIISWVSLFVWGFRPLLSRGVKRYEAYGG